jgi:hypothetical protein
MWHDGDYRVVFRHEDVGFHNGEEVMDALVKTWEQGDIKGLASDPAYLNLAVIAEVSVVTTVVLQKRVKEDDLTAWATLAIGYAFCSHKDQFDKSVGRELAFKRAIKQLDPTVHLIRFARIFLNNIKPKKEKDERRTKS